MLIKSVLALIIVIMAIVGVISDALISKLIRIERKILEKTENMT